MEKQNWSLLGQYDKAGRNSTFGYIYAVLLAMATFQSHAQRYKVEMCIIVLAAAIFIMMKALKKLSILGVSAALFSLIWLAPIANATVFYHVDLTFVAVHGILAMLVGIGAFTFLKD